MRARFKAVDGVLAVQGGVPRKNSKMRASLQKWLTSNTEPSPPPPARASPSCATPPVCPAAGDGPVHPARWLGDGVRPLNHATEFVPGGRLCKANITVELRKAMDGTPTTSVAAETMSQVARDHAKTCTAVTRGVCACWQGLTEGRSPQRRARARAFAPPAAWRRRK